jgi:hypothetical protein
MIKSEIKASLTLCRVYDAGGDGLAEADPHRAVGAGVEAGTGVGDLQLGEADIHRAGAPRLREGRLSALRIAFFGIQAATSRRRGSNPPGRYRHRSGLIIAAFSAAFWAIIWRRGVSFGWNHWRPAKALFNCPVLAQAGIALPEPVLGRASGPTRGPTNATSVGLLWPISSGAMSSWMTFMSLA